MTLSLVALALASCADRLGADATAVLARLGGELGDATLAAHRELAALDPAARKRRRAEIATVARHPTPASLRAVHPTWVEAALTPLPARARTAIAGELATPIDVWLARWATASLPPVALESPRTDLDRISALAAASLDAWLTSIALDQLAFALGDAASAGQDSRLRDAAVRITRAPRVAALGPQRAALLRCRGATLDDPLALVIVASRALAPHLVDAPYARLAITRRLPLSIGSRVERELLAHAATPLDQAPAWSALIAFLAD